MSAASLINKKYGQVETRPAFINTKKEMRFVGILLAFCSAFFVSSKDAVSKLVLKKNINEYFLLGMIFFFNSIIIFPFLFLAKGSHDLTLKFCAIALISAMIKFVCNIAYIKAIKLSDLSLVSPMINFTPLFLMISSPIMLGEHLNCWGIVGVSLIVLGAYLLKITNLKQGVLGPIKTLWRDRGVKMMLLVAVLWSITSNIDKWGVRNSTVVIWIALENFLLFIFFLPFLISGWKKRNFDCNLLAKISLISLLDNLSSITQMTAIVTVPVTYVISIKRTSTLISVGWGWWLFKEKEIKSKLLGSMIMILGVIIIYTTR